MEKTDLNKLINRAMSDPVFRSQLLADPGVAVSEAGWDLPPDDMAALKAWQANLQDVTKLDEIKRSLEALLASRMPKTCE